MKNFLRIIPWLEVKNSNLIKGINMEGLRTIGDPVKFAKQYYNSNADEIILYDVVASLYDQDTMLPLISKVSENIFIPLVVSGGIRSIQDIRKVLKAGADRVCLNSVTFKKKNFVKEAVEIFGSSTISINLQIMRQKNHKYYCFFNNGREKTGVELNNWINHLIDQGVGELIVSSIDKDGSMQGIDLDLIKYLNPKTKIPIILHGGCNGSEHKLNFDKSKIDGLAIASLFHYNLTKNQKFNSYVNKIGNFEYLQNKKSIYFSNENKKFLDLKDYKKLMSSSFNIRN